MSCGVVFKERFFISWRMNESKLNESDVRRRREELRDGKEEKVFK
jgi:hypothetical protein